MEEPAELCFARRLARELRVPVKWLVNEAIAGRIPCLRVGRTLLFDLNAVRCALAHRASYSRLQIEDEFDGK